LRCAFDQLHLHALLRTRQGSGQAANAAACDQHLLVCHVCHECIVRESQALNLSNYCSGTGLEHPPKQTRGFQRPFKG
jgi:hypothetical protein